MEAYASHTEPCGMETHVHKVFECALGACVSILLCLMVCVYGANQKRFTIQ